MNELGPVEIETLGGGQLIGHASTRGSEGRFAQLQSLKVGVVLAVFGATILAGCAGSTTKTIIATSPTSAGSPPASSTPTSSTPAASPQIFHGNGQQDLGTITVPADTTISWNCPSCGDTNFIVNNAQSDANQITTNGLDQTQGVDPLPAGVYNTVVVDTTAGPWTVAIGGTAPPPSGASPTPAPPSGSSGNTTACDQNISAGSDTSCPFAENVFRAYAEDYQAHGEQSSNKVTATSPVTGQTYSMSCNNDGTTVTCTGGNNALVTFPFHAVQVY